jgi:hypothetical protein
VNIMTCYIILHNMITEDENEEAKIHIDLNVNLGASITLPPEVSTQVNPCFEDVRGCATKKFKTTQSIKDSRKIWLNIYVSDMVQSSINVTILIFCCLNFINIL